MKRMTRILTITVIVAVIAVGFVGCEPEVVDYHHNYDHYGTIYAFGKVMEVVGVNAGTSKNKNNVKIETKDFKAAMERLQYIMAEIESWYPEGVQDWDRYVNMSSNPIRIEAGDVAPAKIGESMTIGVEFLTEKTDTELYQTIDDLVVVENAFGKATP